MKAKKIAAVLLAGLVLGSVALSGCGKLNTNATAVTIDDTKVSLGFANFAAKYQQAICDKYYVAYFGKDVWKQESNAHAHMNTASKYVCNLSHNGRTYASAKITCHC